MKVSIIGTGHVGTAIAFALVAKGACSELFLVNRTRRKAEGEAADLQHAAAFSSRSMRIASGDISQTQNSHVVVLSVSAPRDVTKAADAARKAQVRDNWQLIQPLMPELVRVNPDAVFLVVSNPVDALTYLTWRVSGLAPQRVIGTGTLIDSARFRSYLSQHMQIHPDDIRAYVLGEHGDTQFPALSVAATGGERFDRDPAIAQMFERTVTSGHEVYAIKGYTNYAIALASTMIIESILLDSHRTMPVSTLIQGLHDVTEVCLSVPAVIGRQGVVRQLTPHLDTEEIQAFRTCGRSVKSVIELAQGIP